MKKNIYVHENNSLETVFSFGCNSLLLASSLSFTSLIG